MEIKNKFGKVLFKSDSPSIEETIEDAIRNGANLIDADLSGADLSYANLSLVNLSGADLINTNLSNADLSGADLSYANLSLVNLSGADLSNADLSGADLSSADLSYANLSLANLREVNLRCADLNKTNLNEANLKYARLSGTNLINAKNVPYVPLACPSEGSFIGWKKIFSNAIEYLVKLRIPEDARRCSSATLKCRCDKAEVLAIECLSSGDKDVKQVVNYMHNECTYTVGEMVYPDSFDECRWNECSHGIHFFINKQDAIDY